MNLLIYSHYFAPSVGGVETIVQSLAAGIAELRSLNGDREFNVTVVTETPAGSHDDAKFSFRVVRRPGVIRLWQLVRSSAVIHAAGPAFLPMFLAWLSHKRCVVEHHGYQATCPNGLFVHQPDRAICPGYFQAGRYGECFQCMQSEFSSGWTAAKLLAFMFPRHWLARVATTNIAVTSHVDHRQKLPHTKVVYHGIEDPLPIPDSSLPSQKLRIAYVGRLVPEKGIPVLLEAGKILKSEGHDFEIRIIGDGSERPKLEEFIQREKLEPFTSITGFLTGDAFARTLRDVSVVVMPSTWEETAGLAAIEQMMRGRLVIAADIGGLTEVLGDTGLKFAAGDAVSLADCLRTVIKNPALIDSFGEKARSRALQLFQRSKMITAHAQIYRHAELSNNKKEREDANQR
jgi:glycosyltransferase involved in cell wall biosynthesis